MAFTDETITAIKSYIDAHLGGLKKDSTSFQMKHFSHDLQTNSSQLGIYTKY